MNQEKKRKRYYLLSAVLLAVFSGTFLLMPLADKVSSEHARAVRVAVGLIFWISGISGYVLLFLAGKTDCGSDRRKDTGKKTGFWPNRVTMAADIIFLMGVVALIALSRKKLTYGYGTYIILFVTVLAFHTRLLSYREPGKKAENIGKEVGKHGERQ